MDLEEEDPWAQSNAWADDPLLPVRPTAVPVSHVPELSVPNELSTSAPSSPPPALPVKAAPAVAASPPTPKAPTVSVKHRQPPRAPEPRPADLQPSEPHPLDGSFTPRDARPSSPSPPPEAISPKSPPASISSILSPPSLPTFHDLDYGHADDHIAFTLNLSPTRPETASMLPFPPSLKSPQSDEEGDLDLGLSPQNPSARSSSTTPTRPIIRKADYDPLTSSLENRQLDEAGLNGFLAAEVGGWASAPKSGSSPGTNAPTRKVDPRPQLVREPPLTEAKWVFKCDVTDPMKVSQAMGAYVLYRVTTRTNCPQYRSSEVTVNRRFSDFFWLFDKLISSHPGIIVPPVPEKQALGRFQEEFVETRRTGLEHFVRKVVSHPVLQEDADLRAFLESETFLADRKRAEGKGFLGVFGGSAAASVPAVKVEVDPVFESRRARIEAFEPQLRALSRALDEWQRLQADLSLATHETAAAMQQIVNADINRTPLSTNLAQLAEIHKRITDLQEKQAKLDIVALDSNAQYYVRVVNSVQIAFASRARAYQAWQSAAAALQRKREALDKLHAARATRSDRIAATIAEIDEIELQTHVTENAFHDISAVLRVELDRFDADMNADFVTATKTFLLAFLESQREITRLWEGYEEDAGS
ncbi:Vacuolar protein sorting-associated protein 5 [Geranomyces michiganensis]|nr:Vacuolar protein sorting-associated protein 5 [Geranomyces michiganensis]